MARTERPSPQEMLARAHAEERENKRGKLRIFFGASPGVGKTFAMLQAAHQRRNEGLDVLVGWVETHGRRETEALLEGLERLPARQISYRGIVLNEFDLDTALARHPALVLVDELAHSNAPGSRNVYRWQDVNELLDAGIHVYSTLNVQHLESLNGVVAQITGVQVRETVPDSVFEQTDEVELVDLPPDDLLQRLREGKVYIAPQAERAIESFFRKHNLVALRDLSLQRTADRVDAQMTRIKRDAGIAEAWPTRERLLVAVGPSPQSANLIRTAYRMATRLQAPWIAVAVESQATGRLGPEDQARVAENLTLAERLGAETLVVAGDSVVESLVQLAHQRNVTRIVVGKPGKVRWRDRMLASPVDELIRRAEGIDILVTRGEPEAESRPRSPRPEQPARVSEYGWTLGALAATTGLSWGLWPILDRLDVAMLYVLCILLVASRFSRGPALLASLGSVAAFDFFFVPPYFTFAVSDVRYVVTFGVLLATGLLVSTLTLRVRNQAEVAREREQRMTLLHMMTRSFAFRRGLRDIAETAASHVEVLYETPAALLAPDSTGTLIVRAGGQHPFIQSEREQAVAKWVLQHGKPAGFSTDTLPESEGLYLPLGGGGKALGVLAVALKRRPPLTPSLRQVLEMFAAQAALALERALLEESAEQTRVAAETERLRNTLLTTISHDLRTPLAAIAGAASGLADETHALDAATRREMVHTIGEEAERLNTIVQDLLDLTRLEAGTVQVKREWYPLEEIVGAVLVRLESALAGRKVELNMPPHLLMVAVDPVLIEQVLVNLLENAAKYTPPGTSITVAAAEAAEGVQVTVSDQGPGIPAGEEERIFEKFYRLESDGRVPGSGLGLAICRAILTAHGGRIWAERRVGPGVAFHFLLPSSGAPPDREAAVPPPGGAP